MVLHNSRNSNRKQLSDQTHAINMPTRSSARTFDRASNYTELPFHTNRSNDHHGYSSHHVQNIHIPSTAPMTSDI